MNKVKENWLFVTPQRLSEVRTIAKVIAENLPSPYALDDVWENVEMRDGGPEMFNLSQAQRGTQIEWQNLAAAVIDAVRKLP